MFLNVFHDFGLCWCSCVYWDCSPVIYLWTFDWNTFKIDLFPHRGTCFNDKIKLTSFTLLAVLFSSFFSCLLLLLFSAAFVCGCPSYNGGRVMEMKRDKKGKKKQREEQAEGTWRCYGQNPEWQRHKLTQGTDDLGHLMRIWILPDNCFPFLKSINGTT